MKIIFDIQITGHHSEYISHIVKYISMNPDDESYVFVVHPKFSTHFPELSKLIYSCDNMILDEVSENDYFKCVEVNLIRRSFREFALLKKFIFKHSAKEAIVLYFNTHQIASIFMRNQCRIRGILFLQFSRMVTNTFSSKLKKLRKYTITYLMCRNKSIDSIYILNDFKSVQFLNDEFKTQIFKYLPDPIPSLVPEDGFSVYKEYGIEINKIIFLHIGSLDERKGTFEILESLGKLPITLSDKVFFLFIGKCKSKKLSSSILDHVLKYPSLLKWDDQFVSNERMKSLFDQCEVVLMPYKNPEASSGILGHSIYAKKKVISNSEGLIGELVKELNIGLLIGEITPSNLVNSYFDILNYDSNDNYLDEYILSHSTIGFSKSVLNG